MTITGWRTRGYLPHRDEPGLVQHVVFNLADAFRASDPAPDSPQERLLWADKELDQGSGERLLAKAGNAKIVEDCLLRDHGVRCALAAWCIMPNHVHVVLEQMPGYTLTMLVQTWKSVTAHAINRHEERQGPVWQREYFDRFMRSASQSDATVAYVENNPVAAGLIERPEDWRFSSAWSGRTTINAGMGAGAPN